MSVEMKPISVIKAQLGIQVNGPVQKFFTSTCRKHMDKYVPREIGILRENITETSNRITYESPYAHYMWEGKVMGPNIPIKENGEIVGWFSPKGKSKKYTGKNIQYHGSGLEGSHWDSRMWTAEKDTVLKEVKAYVDGGTK